MALPGEYFEVKLDEERNPYTATVVTESNYDAGSIRVEPPFYATDEYLGFNFEGDLGVALTHSITTEQATLLQFQTEKVLADDVEWAVRHTVSSLLEALGKAASKALFLEEYGIKTDER